VLALQDGTLLLRSDAVLESGERLGGLWRIGARAARLLPRAWRDRVYDAIARNRSASCAGLGKLPGRLGGAARALR